MPSQTRWCHLRLGVFGGGLLPTPAVLWPRAGTPPPAGRQREPATVWRRRRPRQRARTPSRAATHAAKRKPRECSAGRGHQQEMMGACDAALRGDSASAECKRRARATAAPLPTNPASGRRRATGPGAPSARSKCAGAVKGVRKGTTSPPSRETGGLAYKSKKHIQKYLRL